jgi:hypothetical protein
LKLITLTTFTQNVIEYPSLSSVHEEVIGYHHGGFGRNRSTTELIFCNYQILKNKWECKATAHQLFIDFKKACDSDRREVLYYILIECGVPMKLVITCTFREQ